MSALRESLHLKIPLKDVELATKKFETCIGRGGYGLVYKGELFMSGKSTTVAVKRLNVQFGQGLKEFLTEIQLLSGQKHPNLISLIGYCDEGEEKIIVYEYAERGSLDRYLRRNNPDYTLTWLKRLKICVDAARGLDYLHNHVGKHQTVIHRDIKSANILIDRNWVAKISDLGLSKLSLAGLNRSAVISHVCGTLGYCEPEYIDSGIVKKESDVYSFGMVLFEVLCGRLCTIMDDDGFLLSRPLVKDYYKKEKLEEIVDPGLREQMSSDSMNKFSAIAYRCLQKRKQRPPVDIVVKELEESLEIQVEYESTRLKSPTVLEPDEYWGTKLPQDSEDIIKRLSPGSIYASKKELFLLLHKGILFDDENRFFYINKDGQKCELISAMTFLDPASNSSYEWRLPRRQLRFYKLASIPYQERLDIRCQISTSMLSYNTMYAATLLFKFHDETEEDFNSQKYVGMKWKVHELSVSSTHLANRTKDGWLRIKMWYFINYKNPADFELVLEKISDVDSNDKSGSLIQGIEFEPIEMKAEHKLESLLASHDDMDWEQKFPSDYEDLIQRSDKQLEYTAKKELYFLFCAGILIDNGKLWFSLCKLTGKKCHMLPAREIVANNFNYKNLDWISLPESRFGEAARIEDAIAVLFTCKPRSDMFSSCSFYSSYLVFKFLNDHVELGDYSHVLEADHRLDRKHQRIPIVKPKAHDSNITNKIEMRNEKRREVIKRKDGWMEVNLCKWLYGLELGHNLIEMALRSTKMRLCGIIVQGIEFRPLQTDV